jgi:hypothetical protein
MWQCECGEFNNEDSAYCLRCNKLRVIKDKVAERQQTASNTQTVFRRIQDFILLDIGVTALLVVYCFWRASQSIDVTTEVEYSAGKGHATFAVPGLAFEAVIPLLVVVILQMALLVHLLRVFYRTAINSERNSIFLQKIYENYEGIAPESDDQESAAQSVVKPPTSGPSKERRPNPPRERGRPRS